MTAPAPPRDEPLRIAGRKVATGRWLEVRYPYTGAVVGRVALASVIVYPK